jgi:hypothetical protein
MTSVPVAYNKIPSLSQKTDANISLDNFCAVNFSGHGEPPRLHFLDSLVSGSYIDPSFIDIYEMIKKSHRIYTKSIQDGL